MKILIIGYTGSLAQIVVQQILSEHKDLQIVGVDSRPLIKKSPENVSFVQMKYSRSRFETLFSNHNFDFVLNLSRFSSHRFKLSTQKLEEEHGQRLLSAKALLDICLEAKVKKVVLLSTHHVYGALPDNPIFLSEDDPLRGSVFYPELRLTVELDHVYTNWVWKNQDKVQGVVLRPTNIIGPNIDNAISKYIRSNIHPYSVDYNPKIQFIYQDDMAKIIINSLFNYPKGIYNVSNDDYISVNEMIQTLSGSPVPIPMFIASSLARVAKSLFSQIPSYMLDFFKYSALLDFSLLKKIDKSTTEKMIESKEALIKTQLRPTKPR